MRKKIIIICGVMLCLSGCGKLTAVNTSTPSNAKVDITEVSSYDKDDYRSKYKTLEVNGTQLTLPMTDATLRSLGYNRQFVTMQLEKNVWCDLEYTHEDGTKLVCSLTCPALLDKADLDDCIVTKIQWTEGNGECPIRTYGAINGSSTEDNLLTFMTDFVDTENGREYFRYSEDGAGHCISATVKDGKITALAVECNDTMYSINSEDIVFSEEFNKVLIGAETVTLPTSKEELEAVGFTVSEKNELMHNDDVLGLFNGDFTELSVGKEMAGAASYIYGIDFLSSEEEVSAKLLNKEENSDNTTYYMYLDEDKNRGMEVVFEEGSIQKIRVINEVE